LEETRRGGWKGELLNLKKDGSELPIALSTSQVRDQGGRVIGLIGVARDISERRRTEEALQRSEEQLRHAQKMEAVGKLAGGVAHDFNNVLTAVTGYTELALTKLATDDPLRRDLEEIRNAGERATALTRQLLAFGRKQILEPQIIDLNTVVSGMGTLLRSLIGEDIELVTVTQPDLTPVQADPGQIERVILNLVVNARDAMPNGGKLTIETANVELDSVYAEAHPSVTPGSFALLAVSDTGCGIDKEIQPRIFEPFFTTKGESRGTGLGLSTVYGIVTQSSGHVAFDSEPGCGTTFRVYLPQVRGRVVTEMPGESDSVRGGSETVLLVEDEDSVRRLAVTILRKNGYSVMEARDGEEAVRISNQHPGSIHLLLTDAVMPRMSGPDLVRLQTSLRPGMKVLYMSGYTDDAIVRHSVLEQGMPFLQKPFTPEMLCRKVREVLDSPGSGASSQGKASHGGAAGGHG
jgi:signal transduction histidine kinase/ActR/RegA family two-component response regulator